MRIILTPADLAAADSVAARRDSESDRMGLKDAHELKATKEEGRQISRLGARGEYAVKVALGWDPELGVNTFKAPDVGPYHVRTSKYPNASLIIRKDDPDGVYILVTTDDEVTFDVAGWRDKRDITGDSVWVETMWRDPAGRPGAWFVPQSVLWSISFLGTR